MRILILISFVIVSANCVGQQFPTEVKGPSNNACGEVSLANGFEKSGMDRYVATPKIIESGWRGDKLYIKTSVVSECCPPDYLGYTINSDTLVLYDGIKQNIPEKDGTHKEYLICMCGLDGCCYEFEYEIPKLDSGRNYLIATQHISSIGRKPYVINYLKNERKSIYYLKCENLPLCLAQTIKSSIDSYKKLRPLYKQLLMELQTEDERKRETVKIIRKTWIEYFSLENAINDAFVRTPTDQKVYSTLVRDQKLAIEAELVELDKLLSETSKYMSGGAFIEKIYQKKD